ncbi:dihydropteroate synthase [Tessaracoccus defluvii]|uniref:Dihydropteroate synthase n=1 Tax=Tessaracoccus defluvii TaxID=1285901 RepID=A0A7H0HAX7_9ACTN|nr:dihydropteroate synthase [Tessaracoccus defluvii]QNP57693.1 dihydropteroate synthase [Tessaracoccus defluvii]
MGILNVTPDSFSDGGDFLRHDVAVAHALRMLADGAAIVDVGGESTRPGAERVAADEEAARVVPVIAAIAAAGGTVSVDTMRAEVARRAVAAGARIVNDVSGGLADPDMVGVVAEAEADFVIMHWRAHSATMSDAAHYGDVVADVRDELLARRDAALAAGIRADRIILDPGLGFAKTWDHNWALLRNLDTFTGLGHRLLVGASRKAFLGGLLGARAPRDRDAATAAVTFWAAQHGAWAVRTHDIVGQADALAVAGRLHDERPLAPLPPPPGERAGGVR